MTEQTKTVKRIRGNLYDFPRYDCARCHAECHTGVRQYMPKGMTYAVVYPIGEHEYKLCEECYRALTAR